MCAHSLGPSGCKQLTDLDRHTYGTRGLAACAALLCTFQPALERSVLSSSRIQRWAGSAVGLEGPTAVAGQVRGSGHLGLGKRICVSGAHQRD